MAIRVRGLAVSAAILCLMVGACTQQQYRSARDNTLSFFGVSRKPAVAKAGEPEKAPPPPAATPAVEEEPVPNAAPRTPVETEGVAAPAGGRTRRGS